jgi:hypothetical protein
MFKENGINKLFAIKNLILKKQLKLQGAWKSHSTEQFVV